MHDFTPSQWNHFNDHVEEIYQQFITVVANGRKMTPERVRELAGGKVYTGVVAAPLGLVDQLGGLATAISVTKVFLFTKSI